MSYILDALRKADAQREASASRGIHAHPVATPARRAAPWPLVAGGLIMIAGAMLALSLWPRAEERPVTREVARDVEQAPAAIAAQPQPQPQPPAVSVLPPAPPPVVAPVTSPVTPATAPTVVPVPALSAAPAQARVASSTAPVAAPTAAADVAATPTDRVHAVTELPADVQRDLPRLPISGGVYSGNAAQRMLIVNGQVVNEGAELAPGLVLEQIRAKSAVLKFRGWRYAVSF